MRTPFAAGVLALLLCSHAAAVQADGTPQAIPFAQAWTDINQITVNDDWSGVPGIVGYRGDGITGAAGADPQTLTGEGTITVDVNANQFEPDMHGSDGVSEFDSLPDPVVALRGTARASAPNLVLNLVTTGRTAITVAYNVRDIDASSSDTIQRVALQYRVGSSGAFTNVPAGYVADATTGPNVATLVTPVSAVLPTAADNQPLVQVRIITANAVGENEAIGIDDLSVTGTGAPPSVSLSLSPASFSEAGGSATVTATLSQASASPVTVELLFSGTATVNTDYAASASTITIPADATSGTIQLASIDDTIVEGNETIVTSLGTLTNATPGAVRNVTATIIENDVPPPPMIGARIYEIQGNRHVSPMTGAQVSNVPGIVTAIADGGFYLQDPDGDGNVDTSDGIFVATGTAPTVSVGQQLLVSGTVTEFRAAGANALSTTEITAPTIRSTSGQFTNTAVVATLIGTGGRVPPSEIIDNDSAGSVETSPTTIFDPAQDAIDFYESLEGMLVRIDSPVLVAPTLAGGTAAGRRYVLLGDDGASATGRNARGGITLVERAAGLDYNPERIHLYTGLPGTNAPFGTVFNVGDRLSSPMTGVLGQSSGGGGNFEVMPIAAPALATRSANVAQAATAVEIGGSRLSIASLETGNYDATDAPDRRLLLAQQIVRNLRSPDIVALGEVRDDNGTVDNGVVTAGTTLANLVQSIVDQGGPRYGIQQIDPVNGADGGEPGGNSRLVQLYNPSRVTPVAGTAGRGDSTSATSVRQLAGRLGLTLSPGRIDPANAVWAGQRKSLAATYSFNDERVLVISSRLNALAGDPPLFGVNQPAQRTSEALRRQQAQVLHDFAYTALSVDPQAQIVLIGDLEDSDTSAPLRILSSGALGANGENGIQPVLANLGSTLIADTVERYTAVIDGNATALDHLFVTEALRAGAVSPQLQIVHSQSEFANAVVTHDPVIASFYLPDITPDPISYAPVTGADPLTPQTSTVATLSGFSVPIQISVTGGDYSINGGAFVTATGTVRPGDWLQLRVVASNLFSTPRQVNVSLGRSTAVFSATTRAPVTYPGALNFGTQTLASKNTIYFSNAITMDRIEVPVAATSIKYSPGDGGLEITHLGETRRVSSGTTTMVEPGDVVRAYLQSSAFDTSTTFMFITIGDGMGQFSVRTRTPISDSVFIKLNNGGAIDPAILGLFSLLVCGRWYVRRRRDDTKHGKR